MDVFNTTIKDIKKLFAKEHITTIGTISGTRYIDAHTGRPLSRREATKIMNGEY